MGSLITRLTSSGNGYFDEKSFREKDLHNEETVFIDMRDKEQYLTSHIRTALHLPVLEVGANKTQLEILFSEAGLDQLLLHYHAREDPLTLILYSSRPSFLLQDLSRLLHYHKEFFSSFSHELYILQDGFDNINPNYCFSTKQYQSTLENEEIDDDEISEIIENRFFIANFKAAKSLENLNEKKIDLILNVSRDMYDPPSCKKYQQISLGDQGELRFLEILAIVIDIIDESLARDENIILICESGNNRSAAAALGFLMQSHRCPLLTAFRYLKDKRPNTKPSIEIMRYLLEMESLLIPGVTIPSFPLKLYISYFKGFEPFEETLQFINYSETYTNNFGHYGADLPIFALQNM